MRAVVVLLILLVSTSAYAQNESTLASPKAEIQPAQAPYCKPRPKRKRVIKKRTKPQVLTCVARCECPEAKQGATGPAGAPGKQGPRGPRGPQGAAGKAGYGAIVPGIGYMATALWPAHDYAWAHGPSLRLIAPLNERTDLLLQVGWALGRDRAVMGQVAVTYWFASLNWLGLGGGFFGQAIGLRDDRPTGFYGGFIPHLGLRTDIGRVELRGEVGPIFALTDYDDTDLGVVGGVAGSVGLSWKW